VQVSGFDNSAITLKVGFWYASTHSSDSAPMDAVVRTIQRTLSIASITPVTDRLDVHEDRTTYSHESAANPKPTDHRPETADMDTGDQGDP
jgi:hypothetical protein